MRSKVPKALRILAENAHRWSGGLFGPPGTGKTTFIRALVRMRPDTIVVSVKERFAEEDIILPEREVVKRISTILHFTATGIKPSFDRLAATYADTLDGLISFTKTLKPDIAEWIVARLAVLQSWRDGNKIVVPTYLANKDEIERRLVIGVLYALRSLIPQPIVIDDALAFVTDRTYKEAAIAMMRPSIITFNHYPMLDEMLMHSPIVLTPGGGVQATTAAQTATPGVTSMLSYSTVPDTRFRSVIFSALPIPSPSFFPS